MSHAARTDGRPTVAQAVAFFERLYAKLGIEANDVYAPFSAGALIAWLENPSHLPPAADATDVARES